MTSLFKWVVNTISSTTNLAAETLLGNIIRRFLEEPIQDDSLSLELFSDWTLHLILKKSFLNVNLVNSYITFAKFKSIYFSNIKFDASYNLSKFVINLTRVVIEIDIFKPEPAPEIDEKLNASIQVFQEQLPIEKGKSFKDWLLDCVQNVNLTLDYFTLVLSALDDLEQTSISIERLTVLYDKTAQIKMPKASLLIGEKRTQRAISQIDNFQLSFANSTIDITIDLITVTISESILKTIFALLDVFLHSDLIKNNANQTPGNESSIQVNFNLKKLTIDFESHFSVELKNLKATSGMNKFSISFESISVVNSTETLFSLQQAPQNQNEIQFRFPNSNSELSLFQDFPNQLIDFSQFKSKSLNSTEISIGISSFFLKITKPFLQSILQIIEWFSQFQLSQPETTYQIKPQSYNVNLKILKVLFEMETLQIGFSKPSFSIFFSKTASNLFFNAFFSIRSLFLMIDRSTSLFHFLKSDNPSIQFMSGLLRYSEQLGKDNQVITDMKIGNFLIRIPSKFDFMNPIFDLLNLLQSKPIQKSQDEGKIESNVNVNVSLDFCNIFIDYMALKMPARLILSLKSFNLNLLMDTSPMVIKIVSNVSTMAYLSNHRDVLNLKIFMKDEFPFSEYNFAQILDLPKITVQIDCAEEVCYLNIDKALVNVSFCFDSLKLFLAFLLHVQYNLDNESGPQPKGKEFDLPQKLMDMTMTLNQSLKLDNFEFNPNKHIYNPQDTEFIPRQFNTLENLVAASRMVSNEEEANDSDLLEDTCDDQEMISSEEPISIESVHLNLMHLIGHVKIFGGRDFDQVYDMKKLNQIPPIETKNVKHSTSALLNEFDFITNRDDTNSVEIEIETKLNIILYKDDPSVSVRVNVEAQKLSVLDLIMASDARLLFGIEDEEKRPIKCRIDVLKPTGKNMELNFKLDLPNLVVFINQEQINFFMVSTQLKMPTFPSDLIVDEPMIFQLFELDPSEIQIAAHFRLWLDIHMDDIKLSVPKCQLFAIRGFDELIGSLAEYYVSEMSRPGVAAVVGGLPVIKNLRRISGAVHDLFTFDVQRYGVGLGFVNSFSALMQIIAMETINMGANATSIAERFLYVAMKFLGGRTNAKEAMETGMATLVIEKPKSTVSAVRKIPTLILAPGVLTFKKLTEMMKNLRDQINPKYKKMQKYKKEKRL